MRLAVDLAVLLSNHNCVHPRHLSVDALLQELIQRQLGQNRQQLVLCQAQASAVDGGRTGSGGAAEELDAVDLPQGSAVQPRPE